MEHRIKLFTNNIQLEEVSYKETANTSIHLCGTFLIDSETDWVFRMEDYNPTYLVQVIDEQHTETNSIHVENKNNFTCVSSKKLVFDFSEEWVGTVLKIIKAKNLYFSETKLFKITLNVIDLLKKEKVEVGHIYISI
ncbi:MULTISPECIES: hypothetical protein [Enterococcus]|uniref:hypothetical protein n=1 Tax=Enterococcus TaxID=1350 RepID=UPI001376BF3B|nr:MULTISPECIES: hypothetical protein [Enterococcus]NBA62468.1 hypothetical protein [Enterococcus mundtii]